MIPGLASKQVGTKPDKTVLWGRGGGLGFRVYSKIFFQWGIRQA